MAQASEQDRYIYPIEDLSRYERIYYHLKESKAGRCFPKTPPWAMLADSSRELRSFTDGGFLEHRFAEAYRHLLRPMLRNEKKDWLVIEFIHEDIVCANISRGTSACQNCPYTGNPTCKKSLNDFDAHDVLFLMETIIQQLKPQCADGDTAEVTT